MAETKSLPELTTVIERKFWNKVNLNEDFSMCWNWKGWVKDNKKPYGVMSINKEELKAHRLSYYINYGTDPKELHVLHKCDNHRCVNPNHLFLGTNADNVADKVSKGRQAKNEAWNKGKQSEVRIWDNPQCKIDKKTFLEIKAIYEKGGFRLQELGDKYGVSKKSLAKGIRELGGIVNPRHTVLNEAQVLSIRSEYSVEAKNSIILGKKYGVGGKTIMDIVHRLNWKHI